MKQLLYYILLLLSTKIFSMEYNTYEMVQQKEFGVTRDNSDNEKLGVEFKQGYSGSYGPSLFFDSNNLTISDFHNNRFLLLDGNFDVIKNITFEINSNVAGNNFRHYFDSDGIIDLGLHILGYAADSGISIFDKETDKIISKINFYTDFNFLANFRSIFYYKNILFIHDKNGKLWSIKNPELDQKKNKINLLSEENTISLIKKGDLQDITIDDKKRIFLNGKLQTKNITNYYEYKIKLRKNDSKPKLDKNYTEDYFISNNAIFIGSDNDNNIYWYFNSGVLVSNEDGWPIMVFTISDQKKVSSAPAVSPDGNVYFLQHSPDKVTLFKVVRRW